MRERIVEELERLRAQARQLEADEQEWLAQARQLEADEQEWLAQAQAIQERLRATGLMRIRVESAIQTLEKLSAEPDR